MVQEPAAKTDPAAQQLKLALDRTFLAYERTLMAWIRTATSLIMFGFGLYKFFYYLHPADTPTGSEQILGARTYGMCMMVIGIFTLAIAAWQYRRQMKAFRGLYPEAPMSLSLIVAALIATLGILAFFAAIFRV
jgi:putative membrane protein